MRLEIEDDVARQGGSRWDVRRKMNETRGLSDEQRALIRAEMRKSG